MIRSRGPRLLRSTKRNERDGLPPTTVDVIDKDTMVSQEKTKSQEIINKFGKGHNFRETILSLITTKMKKLTWDFLSLQVEYTTI